MKNKYLEWAELYVSWDVYVLEIKYKDSTTICVIVQGKQPIDIPI
jgi:hypothetical protein